MKIFSDPELKHPLEYIHFGTVKVGTIQEISVYLYNDSEAVLANLVYHISGVPSGELVEVITGPIQIEPRAVAEVRLRWKPSLTFRKPLNVRIGVEGSEIFYAKVPVTVQEEVKR